MGERLQYWVAYIGSAAMAAFLAACLQAPRVATFACDTPLDAEREQCHPTETLPVAAAATPASGAGNEDPDETTQLASLAAN